MEMRGEEILSICVGTIHRPYCMQRFVNSVRANFPAIPIIVGSQDKPNSYLEAFFRENDVEVIYIQEDAGVGVARNATVAAARTEFVLICDDDFIFSSETKLEAPLRILAADKSIDIVGGAVTDIVGGVDAPGWKVRRWEEYLYRDKDRGHLITACIDLFSPIRKEIGGIPYFITDTVLNWKVVRKSAFERGAGWDPRYKCNGEHEDFYLNIRENTDLGVAYCPEFMVYHHSPEDFTYAKKRDQQDGWKSFSQKWGVNEVLEVDDHYRAVLPLGHFWLHKSQTADPAWPQTATYIRAPGQTFGPLDSRTWPASRCAEETLNPAPDLQVTAANGDAIEVTVSGGERFSIIVAVDNRSGGRIGCFGQHALSFSYKVRAKGDQNLILERGHVTALNHDLMQGITFHVVNMCADWEAIEGETYDLEIDLLSQGGWLNRPVKARVRVESALPGGRRIDEVVIDFRMPGIPDQLTSVQGLSAVEHWGRWSDANLAKAVTLQFMDTLPARFKLELNCQAFGPNAEHPVMVEVGQKVLFFWPTANFAAYTMEFVLDTPERIIKIVPSLPTSPASLNVSTDTRCLGVGLAKLKITSEAPATAAPSQAAQDQDDLGEEVFWEQLYSTEDPWQYRSAYEQTKYAQTLELLPQEPIGRALEIGCAEGRFTTMLAARAGRVTAIDISELALARARERCREFANTSFECLDISWEFPSGTFDLIVCSEVLYYMQDRFALKKIVDKISKVLAPNGYLVMAHANSVNDDRTSTGFDFAEIGALFIGQAFAEEPEFEFLKELRTPLYKVQLFRRRPIPMVADVIPLEQRILPREVIERSALFEHPLLKWGGCVVTRAEARFMYDTAGVPVLMYHRVASSGPEGLAPWRLDPEKFEQQLSYLQRYGYSAMRVDGIWKVNASPGGQKLEGKRFALTFDDGYQDFADVAWPLLKRYGFCATVFLVTDHVGGRAEWDRDFGEPAQLMDWATIKRLASEGVDFGSHSCSHPKLTTLSPQAMMKEAAASREILAAELGAAPSGFCFPYTDYDANVIEAVKAAGYDYALAGKAGESARTAFALPRIEINDDSVDRFAAKLPSPVPSSPEKQAEYRRLRSLRDRGTHFP